MKIKEILEHPATSTWLKESLQSALKRDCLDAAKDADLLARILNQRVDDILRKYFRGEKYEEK